MTKAFLIFLSFTFASLAKTNLLFYCGITMVPAVIEAKGPFEKEHNCTITIVQGGSKDLCKSIESTKKGDLFLPGKQSYIDECVQKGHIFYQQFVGYNRLAIFVKKGNPKQIKGLNDLLREDILTTLGNPKTCSIGKNAEETLIRYAGGAFLKRVQNNLGTYAADSRDMNTLLMDDQADAGLNWVASSHSKEAEGKVDTIPISDLYAPPQRLVAAVLRFSPYADTAKAFVDYLASTQGKFIMKKHGFSHE